MRRSRIERAFAALMLLWLTVFTVEPDALHSCPLHSRSPAAERDVEATSHGAHGAAPRAQPGDAQNGQSSDQHQCVCIGQCRAGVPLIALPSATQIVPAVGDWLVRVELERDPSAIVAVAPFFLPFANGPPVGLRVA